MEVEGPQEVPLFLFLFFLLLLLTLTPIPPTARHGTVRHAANLKLTTGLLFTISSGLIIYAACVEMLAGDLDPSLWKRSVKEQAIAVGGVVVGAAGMSVIGL